MLISDTDPFKDLSMMDIGKTKTAVMETRDGVYLRYGLYPAQHAPCRGTIVLVHGRSEFLEKYHETIGDLTAAGFAVASFDLRGQGLSKRLLPNGLRGYVRRFDDYLDDLLAFITQIVRPSSQGPIFLLAHSTGGLIALKAAPRLNGLIARMVLSAPFVGLQSRGLSQQQIFLIARIVTAIGLGRHALTKDHQPEPFAENILTSDPERYARNREFVEQNPALALSAPSARWLHECAKAMRHVLDPRHLQSIAIPCLILAPKDDQIVPLDAQKTLAKHFTQAQLQMIDNCKHEVLQERDDLRRPALAKIIRHFTL